MRLGKAVDCTGNASPPLPLLTFLRYLAKPEFFMECTMQPLDDLRIASIDELIPPVTLLERHPLTTSAAATINTAREGIHAILHGTDDRLLVVVGPCSIHDVDAAREYATRLRPLTERYRKQLLIVMRVYFEKPRTTVGWKGLLNDPFLDGSFAINEGLSIGRKLLLDLAELGIPTAVEYLDVISPQYIADLVSWGAIGARTSESQIHRQLASGLSCPIGFKNATNGDVQIAVDAIVSARCAHSFLGATKSGHAAIVSTRGNGDCHLILRGGSNGPNYDAAHVKAAVASLAAAHVPQNVMIDCSHANSNKQYLQQMTVATSVAAQIAAGDRHIIGLMAESNLVEGAQKLEAGKPLTYGQSITDPCIGWEDTEKMLALLADAVMERQKKIPL